MSTPAYHIEPLDPANHRHEAFDCGVEPLNRYLHEQARLDMKRRAAGCWVLVDAATPWEILGYYTLSPEVIVAAELPATLAPELAKKIPPYARLGAYLIGRFAILRTHQGRKLGHLLFLDALYRCASLAVPAVFVVDRKSTRLNSSHIQKSRMPSSA